MNIRLIFCTLFLTAAFWASASPQGAAGRADGPVIAVVSGASGSVRLLHGTKVLHDEAAQGRYTAAVVLAGPLDRVEWDGGPVDLLPAGKDPAAAAKQALEGRTAGHLFALLADGTLVLVHAPEGDYDGTSAATAEE